jgi:phosphoribosylformylglycinamidine cyclo-ligase
MPDLYKKGDLDLAGFCVGDVELSRVQKPARVREGDVILGLASDGIHSNGYTLVRKVVSEAGLDLNEVFEELQPAKGRKATTRKAKSEGGAGTRNGANAEPRMPNAGLTLGQVLLTPTRLYADPICRMLRQYHVKNVVTGMAHITGSGIPGNLCRALPPTLDAQVDRSAWPVLPVFRFLQEKGNIPEAEMWRIFNMGLGYCVIVKPSFAEAVSDKLKKLGERVYTIGTVVKGKGEVRWAQ